MIRRNYNFPTLAILATLVVTVVAVVRAAEAQEQPVRTDAVGNALAAAILPEGTKSGPGMSMSDFLDRLMIAESGGNNEARNPKSSAVGPFQFIESTWLDVMRRHFAAETQALPVQKVLLLRTDRVMARRAAEAFTKDNAAHLTESGVQATFANLRLAFLVGSHGAVKVLKAAPDERVVALLGPGVGRANPFMYGLTASGLIARAARDLQLKASSLAALAASDIPSGPSKASAKKLREPQVAVNCNLSLPSCRRWLVLAKARKAPPKRRVARISGADQ